MLSGELHILKHSNTPYTRWIAKNLTLHIAVKVTNLPMFSPPKCFGTNLPTANIFPTYLQLLWYVYESTVESVDVDILK